MRGGHPVYAACLLVAAFVASMLATTVLMGVERRFGLGQAPVHERRRPARAGVARPLLRPLELPEPGLRDRHGDPRLVRARGGVVLGRPSSLLQGSTSSSAAPSHAGRHLVPRHLREHCVLAVFIAFAAIYPDVGIFFGVPSGRVAAILVGSTRHGPGEPLLGGRGHPRPPCGFAFFFIRAARGLGEPPSLRSSEAGRGCAWSPGSRRMATRGPRASKAGSMAEVDALLDKIATSGFSELTAKERARLDSAHRGSCRSAARAARRPAAASAAGDEEHLDDIAHELLVRELPPRAPRARAPWPGSILPAPRRAAPARPPRSSARRASACHATRATSGVTSWRSRATTGTCPRSELYFSPFSDSKSGAPSAGSQMTRVPAAMSPSLCPLRLRVAATPATM